jgi:hypothetical protein
MDGPLHVSMQKTIDACSDLNFCRQLGAGALPRAPGSVEKLKLGERAKGSLLAETAAKAAHVAIRTDRELLLRAGLVRNS